MAWAQYGWMGDGRSPRLSSVTDINEDHGRRAEPFLKSYLSKLEIESNWNNGASPADQKSDYSREALDTLLNLCNTMVVKVMSDRTHGTTLPPLSSLSACCCDLPLPFDQRIVSKSLAQGA